MALKYEYVLTEEIARWAFEVRVSSLPSWFLSFTNPTAGPWKRLLGRDSENRPGEVYRFPREEPRPDIVMVCDRLRLILIIEAKDCLDKLLPDEQLVKSSQVVGALANLLSRARDNPFWGRRAEYIILPGLLWGAASESDPANRQLCFDKYRKHIARNAARAVPAILGVECEKKQGSSDIKIRLFLNGGEQLQSPTTSNQILRSLEPIS